MGSRLIKGSRISDQEIRGIIRMYVLEVPALKAAKELGVNRHTVERIYTHIRREIVRFSELENGFSGSVEVDESYFGGQRKGKRGRGAAGKVVVFGILKRQGKVFCCPIPDVTRATLRSIIQDKIEIGSTIYSDSLGSYDGLITLGYKHYRINHQKAFAQGKRRHINGIENFWGFAKTKLRRYYGISRSHFFLYLKEMEFRFNYRNHDLSKLIESILKATCKLAHS